MRMKFIVLTVLAICIMFSTAFAADITGTWKGSMDMMGQSMELGFKFKADGNTLTGTSIGPQGDETPISDGKIDGDKISFTVKITGQMEMTINYKGTVAGDEIKLTMEMAGMGGPGGGGPGGGGMEMPELVVKKVE